MTEKKKQKDPKEPLHTLVVFSIFTGIYIGALITMLWVLTMIDSGTAPLWLIGITGFCVFLPAVMMIKGIIESYEEIASQLDTNKTQPGKQS